MEVKLGYRIMEGCCGETACKSKLGLGHRKGSGIGDHAILCVWGGCFGWWCHVMWVEVEWCCGGEMGYFLKTASLEI